MKHGLARRLDALEALHRMRVPSDAQYEAALERMRCRFTVFRARMARASHEINQLMGLVPADAPPPSTVLTAEEEAELRNWPWDLPCVSLKPPAEAAAFLGRDDTARVAHDIETLRRWGEAHGRGRGESVGWAQRAPRKRPYEIALDEYERTGDPRPLLTAALTELRASGRILGHQAAECTG